MGGWWGLEAGKTVVLKRKRKMYGCIIGHSDLKPGLNLKGIYCMGIYSTS